MASEAQRLIGISLTKIAQSRSYRGGVSLHKNLLVATVLQKARYIFMEEAYNMVHFHAPVPVQPRPIVPEEDLVGLTAEEAGLERTAGSVQQSSSSGDGDSPSVPDFLPSCARCGESQQDKENYPPCSELTYLDLDKTPKVLRERSNSLKRRRAVAEWETEEAVQSILPKKSRHEEEISEDSSDSCSSSSSSSSSDDSVFLDDATLLSDIVSKEVEADRCQQETAPNGSAMEIDRITSLVSIFSFSMGASDGAGKLNRSMSTPDLCSAQAKDSPDSIQQRPFLAMTV
ncbi:immediate early response gene 5-like protein [Euwallacea fornicatus]|uniref:immediate early response gene 5-like protein n=1 Tax=Euwallacea fornicatus TaxID=995702 RepID=UPI00338FB90A